MMEAFIGQDVDNVADNLLVHQGQRSLWVFVYVKVYFLNLTYFCIAKKQQLVYYIFVSPVERLKTVNPGPGHCPLPSSPPQRICQLFLKKC